METKINKYMQFAGLEDPNCLNIRNYVNMNIYSIYRITNLITNKVYIGYTSDPLQRWKDHLRCCLTDNSNKILYKSMRKHGVENFIFEVIYQSTDQKHTMDTMENYFILEYNSCVSFFNSHGYNMTLGGDGIPGLVHSIHTRERISQSMQGENNPNFGKTLSVDTKKKISLALTGHTASIECRAKMSLAGKGKSKSDEHRFNISSAMKGVKRSRIICPHCSKLGGSNNMKRYHFDNCKEKQ